MSHLRFNAEKEKVQKQAEKLKNQATYFYGTMIQSKYSDLQMEKNEDGKS